MIIKVLSWNIFRGQSFDKIVNYLSEINAEILCLQEVIQKDSYSMAQDLAKKLNLNYCHCLTFHDDRHEAPPSYDQGDAILTKFPILNKKCHMLSDLSMYKKDSETEPRGAVEIEISINSKKLTIFNTHLAYSNNFNYSPMQSLQLKNLLKKVPTHGTILTGDFNCHPESEIILEIETHFDNAGANSTQVTTLDNRKIDYIFVSKDLRVKSFEILQHYEASDHYPILSEIEI